MYTAKKRRKTVEGNNSADYKARSELEIGGFLGAGTTKQGDRGQAEPTKRLESHDGTANAGLTGALERTATRGLSTYSKRSTTCDLITVTIAGMPHVK